MFNLVVLTGRLTNDVELKVTTSGISVCNFTIAVDRAYKKGEEKLNLVMISDAIPAGAKLC